MKDKKIDPKDFEERLKKALANFHSQLKAEGDKAKKDDQNAKRKLAVVEEDEIEESDENLMEARIRIIKARIRGGKIQRRKRVSNVAGMTIRGGKLTRMSPSERRRRKLGAKRAKLKRRSKKAIILMKRRRSLRKRQSLGL